MEKSIDRLTRKIRYGQGEFAKMRVCIAGEEGCTRYPKSCAECDDNKAVIDRLAAYEDILYTPSGKELITIDRLRELAQADKDGRCVVLPCKVGDTVYVISHCENVMMQCDDDYETGTGFRQCPFENSCAFEDCDDSNKRIFETTCAGFYLADGKSDIFFEHLNAEFYISDFGKTAFLTRAEAEAALRKLDGGGQDARKGDSDER